MTTMNKQKRNISLFRTLGLAACCALTLVSCDDDIGNEEVANEPYVLSVSYTHLTLPTICSV